MDWSRNASAQSLAVLMLPKRRRVESHGAPREASAVSAVQPQHGYVTPPHIRCIWTMKPSRYQPPPSEFELTHDRSMPLPFAIDVEIDGKTQACRYCGHGQSKVVYTLTDEPTRVLKLTAKEDQEPHVCQQLARDSSAAQPAVKICPTIYAIGRCEEQDLWGKPKRNWCAWLAQYAIPLDKYLQRRNVDCKACLEIALYKQVIAAQHGVLLSDNNLFNFGVVEDTVVIIDVGSRPRQKEAIPKSTMNSKAMKGWFRKLAWHGKRTASDGCRATWSSCGSLEEVAQLLCNTRLCPLSNSVEQPVPSITQAPSVWALLDEDPENHSIIQWLLDYLLWGDKLMALKLLQTGETIPLEEEEVQAPHIRLETLIKVTEQRRSKYIKNPNDILPEHTLKILHDEWKDDYKAWMNRSSQARWNSTHPRKRHEYQRTRFRTFLFQMCGSYDLVMFWLRVQASWTSLCIFQEAFQPFLGKERTDVPLDPKEREAAKKAAMDRAVEAVRDGQWSRSEMSVDAEDL